MPNYALDNQQTKIADPYAARGQGLKPLKTLGKRKALKAMRPTYDGLGPIGGEIKFLTNIPEALMGAEDGVVHLDDPDVQELLGRLETNTSEDQAMARRVVDLKRKSYGNSPYTELIAYDWFTQRGQRFDYQVPLGGGRSTKFGQVLDFALYEGGEVTAMPVQGQYWHSLPAVASSDELDMLQAMASLIGGQRVTKYIPVWERWLYKDRDQVLTFALAGVALGQ